jgi:ABC-type nitrate/sulfonate/bicarbonate transport system substrate-binding protein
MRMRVIMILLGLGASNTWNARDRSNGQMKKFWRARSITATLALVCVLGTVTGCSGGEGSDSKDGVIRMAVQQINFATIPLTLADELGYFEDEGLELDIPVSESTSTTTSGLIGGSFDMQVGGAELLVARAQGAPIIGFAGLCNGPVWSAIAKPGINALEDLKGVTIATSGPDSISTAALVKALRAAGVEPDSYEQVTAGGTSSRFAAVENGQADATIVAAPLEFQAKDFGMTNLGSLYDALPDFASGLVVTTEDYAAHNAETVNKFARAYVRGLQYLHDPKNKDDVVARVAAVLETPEDVVSQAYDYWIASDRKMFPEDGRIDLRALEGAAEALKENGSLESIPDLEAFIDNSFVDDAVAGS